MNASSSVSGLVTVATAASLCGVSPSQIRLLCASGELEHATTFGGHRRISVASIRRWAGQDLADDTEGNGVAGKRVAVYLRVSSAGQNVKSTGLSGEAASSLDRQRERVLREAAEREGVSQADLLVFQDVASSFADTRSGLNRLLDAIIGGQVSRLYVLQIDRLSRLGCTLGIVRHLAESHGVEIVFLDTDVDESEQTSDFQELMLIVSNTIQHSCAVMAGRKSAKVVRKHVSDATKLEARRLRKEGLGLDQIAERLNAAGHTTHRQDGSTHPITRHVLHKHVFGAAKGRLETATPKDCRFRSWFDSALVPVAGHRLPVDDVYTEYRRYCELRGEKQALQNHMLGRQVKHVVREHRQNKWWFVGFAFAGQAVESARIPCVDSFAAFFERNVVAADDDVFLTTRDIWTTYTAFCKANRLTVESRKHCGLFLKTKSARYEMANDKSFRFYGLRMA